MKSLVMLTLLVGVVSLSAAKRSDDLELIKKLLAAVQGRREDSGLRKAGETVSKRESYGVIWNNADSVLSVVLHKAGTCSKDPCTYTITFHNPDTGKTIGNEIDTVWNPAKKGIKTITLDQIIGSVADNKVSEGENNANSLTPSGERGELPRYLLVKVCRHDEDDEDVCNKRIIDTSKNSSNFYLEEKDD